MSLPIKLLFYLAILILLFVGYYQLFRSISLKDKIRQNMDRVYSELASKDRKRISEIEKERREFGTIGGDKGNTLNIILDKIDKLLVYSRASIRYVWLNTSTFIVLEVLALCVTFLVGLLFIGNVVVSLFLSIIVICLPLVLMTIKADQAYRNTEKQLTMCIHIVENVGYSTGNVVTVIKEVSKYMAEPLASSMERAVAAANVEEDDSACVRLLEREIEHPMFIRFVRHLEISAKNDSDFKSVAADYGEQVDTALKNAQRMKAIFDNGKASILSLIGISILMIFMMTGYTGDGSLIGMLVEMSHNIFGAFVLIFTGLIYLAAFLYIILGMRR